MYFSYVVARDFGFAPNPFNGICTLATCKPKIRSKAVPNDWIFGCGAAKTKCKGKLLYAMKVTKKITFNEYFSNQRHSHKKPIMNGSLKNMYGDNIYHLVEKSGKWNQINSHHSYSDGSINYYNLNRDTQCKYLLLSDHFYYWGRNCIDVPNEFKSVIHSGIGHKSNAIDINTADNLVHWIYMNFDQGYLGDPIQFENEFERYSGK